MFSNLGNIFTGRPRLAESADARLDIRRHDPDHEQRSGKERDPENKPRFDTYDNAVVSVESLRVFLENFLASLTVSNNNSIGSLSTLPAKNFNGASNDLRESVNLENKEPPERPISAQASRAANIYQAGAKTAPRRITPAPTPTFATEPVLANEDIRLIHRLLRDIAILQTRRVDYLTIERGETFLTSLAAATDKALRS